MKHVYNSTKKQKKKKMLETIYYYGQFQGQFDYFQCNKNIGNLKTHKLTSKFN